MRPTRKTAQSPPPPLGGVVTDDPFGVGVYLRVSTDRQAEGESLKEQEDELLKYCQFKGYRIHKIYKEEGKSGGTPNRPEYQQLIADIQSKKINAVLVKKLDRLSRSLLDFESLMVTLQTHSVDFISLREQFDTTNAMGKAMLRIALVFAQLEREQTSERISDVMVYRASKGLYNGGTTPFGYICVNKEWQPDKKEKPVVELLFQTFIQTRSTIATASLLNRDGIKNRKGNLWDCRRVLDILKSPIYIGSRRWKGRVFPDTHSPIISEKVFEQTQSFLKTIAQPVAIKSPFQRLLICGHCLSPMSPRYSLNRTKCRYYYYRCTQHSQTGKPVQKCESKAINFGEMEQRVAQAFERLSHPDHLKSIENQVIKHNHAIETQTELMESEIRQFKLTLSKLKDRQDQFLDSLILPNLTTVDRRRINAKLEELDIEVKQLQTVLNKKEFERQQKADELFNLIEIKQFISECISLDSTDPVAYRASLQRLIDSITVYPSKLTVQFRWIPWTWEVDV